MTSKYSAVVSRDGVDYEAVADTPGEAEIEALVMAGALSRLETVPAQSGLPTASSGNGNMVWTAWRAGPVIQPAYVRRPAKEGPPPPSKESEQAQ